MKRGTSLYLDLVRFAAAVTVLLTHLAYPRFSDGLLLPLRSVGNDAVMVFFVLSGYVIAHTAAERDATLARFALNRAARLYSVALPAVLLTVVADQLGRHLTPTLYAGFQYRNSEPLWRIVHALSFTNELWFSSWRLFSNGPYWSLGYEAWYYLLFGCAWYLRGASRMLALALALLLMGPKILLLLPVWTLGVAVYAINRRAALGARWGLALWGGSLAAYGAFRALGLPAALLDFSHTQWGRHFVEHSLQWSNEFLASYVIGVLVALNFIGMNACAALFARCLARFERPIRACAACTFSVYLFHYPLLQCLAATGAFPKHSPLAVALLALVTLMLCALLARYTEQRKQALRTGLVAVAQGLRRRLPEVRASW